MLVLKSISVDSIKNPQEHRNYLQLVFDLDQSIRETSVILRIYQLDHQKGNLEKNYAKTLVSGDYLTNGIQGKIKDCIALHSVCVDELEKIRLALILRLDELIALE